MLQITDSKRAKFEEGLEGQWPISDTLYLKYIGEGTLEKEIFISFFEESFFQPVPVLFPDMDTFKEKTEEDFNEHYKKYE